MPTSPRPPCPAPGCAELQPCRRHDRRRPRPDRDRVYGRRWRRARQAKLHRDPWCERCSEALAEEVHHRTGTADGGDHQLENLESLCTPCHRQVEAERRRAAS